ncbi:MAG: hypothetical protein ABFD97_20365 [Syntrophobacter sp.]
MKSLIRAILSVLLVCTLLYAGQPSDIKLKIKTVSTQAELTAQKDFAGTVIVNAPITLTAATTTTCALYINVGCPITTNGKLLTENGPHLSTGAYQQYITAAGEVVFGKQTKGYAEWFGVVGDYNGSTGTDNYVALKAFFASGLRHFVFGQPKGRYKATITKFSNLTSPTTANFLANFIDTTGITIEGEGVTLEDTEDKGNYYSVVFGFNNCSQVKIRGVNYIGAGTPYNDPTVTGGALFVYAINGGSKYDIKANVQYARYGIASGEYNSYSKGGVNDWDIDLVADYVAYPVAFWFSGNNSRGTVEATSTARPLYLAGVDTADFKVRTKILYAPIACTVTSARSGTTSAFGGRNITIDVVDTGSTDPPLAACYLAGIVPSQIPDATTAYTVDFDNIKFRFKVINTDTLASTTGGFLMQSPYNGSTESRKISIRNLDISGTVDSSAFTGTSAGGATLRPFQLMSGYDTAEPLANSMKIENIHIHDLYLLKGTAAVADAYQPVCHLNGLVGNALIENAYSTYEFPIYSPSTLANVIILNSNLQCASLSSDGGIEGGKQLFLNTTIADPTGQSFTTKQAIASKFGASEDIPFVLRTVLTLSGATTTWSNAIPANSRLDHVTGKVTEEITGATGYQVGVSGDADRYANRSATAVGDVFDIANYATDITGPLYYRTATSLVVTAKTSNFTGGKMSILMRGIRYTTE